MNSQRRQFLRQGAAFRPRLERLERRDCPSCTVFQKEETLVILGDEGANQIAIADTREGDIVVTCDVGDPHRFSGVNRIDLRTLGGDDEITATFNNPPDPVFHFRADLGAGNDRLSISGFDPQPDPPLRLLSFDIHAGGGDDEIAARFSCPSDHFHFRADLGGGDDRLSISGFDPQPDPPLASVEFDIRAGAGDDEVLFDLGGAEINGRFLVSAHGGLGNDRLSFGAIIPCVLPEGELRIALDGGAGDDLIDVAMAGLEIEGGLLALEVHGGIGNDHLIVGIVPCVLPESEARIGIFGGAGDDLIEMSLTGLENEGRLLLEAAGGFGNDHLVLGAIQPCILPESETRIALLGNAGDDLIDVSISELEIEGQFDLSVLGGVGNDILDSFIIPCILPAGRASLLFDGEAGDDQLLINKGEGEIEGQLEMTALGGVGNDIIELLIIPCVIPAGRASFIIDGEAGDDQLMMDVGDGEISGNFMMSIGGGAGDDILDSFIQPCVLPAGRANFLFDGEAGDDRIATRIELDADSRGALAAGVFGGLGDDDLTLALFGVDDLSLLLALVDGGREFDIARVTRNVRVANCEEVIFLDEPR